MSKTDNGLISRIFKESLQINNPRRKMGNGHKQAIYKRGNSEV